MNLEQFTTQTREFLAQERSGLLAEIPSGSGIYSITTVGPQTWQPPWNGQISGFVSKRPGRWNLSGEAAKYFGDALETCSGEIFGTGANNIDQYVCERWQTTGPIQAFDIRAFPPELQNALYEDKGPPEVKWRKSHALLSVARELPNFSGVRSVIAPSASGDLLGIGGYVFATDPTSAPVTLVETGSFSTLLKQQILTL